MNELTVESENADGWTIRCDGCAKTETFPQAKLADALLQMNASGRWKRKAPMALQKCDWCVECAEKYPLTNSIMDAQAARKAGE